MYKIIAQFWVYFIWFCAKKSLYYGVNITTHVD